MNLASSNETINNETWFVPLDIAIILCTFLAILSASIFLLVIVFDQTCHTVPMMLVGHTYLAEVICASVALSMAIFTLENDIERAAYQDLLCSFRGYLLSSAAAAFNSSFLLQALYRYILVVYPKRMLYQSAKFQIFLIFATWICSFTYSLLFLLRKEMIYDVDNQICQLIFNLSFSSIYYITGSYILPVSLTGLVYIRLLRYVKRMQKNVVVANALIRARNELKMIVRLLIMITILVVICSPYALFLFMSFFDRAPKYKFRMGYLFVDLSLICVNMAILRFTDQLKSSVLKILRRQNTIATIIV